MITASEEFVKNCHLEKNKILNEYFDLNSESSVSSKIKKLNLSDERLKDIQEILDLALTDSFYALLMGLSGSGSIGDKQIEYQICDDNDNELDEIEEHAWTYFQED